MYILICRLYNKENNEMINPMNSAGEYLYYEEKDIKDKDTEGTVLESGFNNGLNAKAVE